MGRVSVGHGKGMGRLWEGHGFERFVGKWFLWGFSFLFECSSCCSVVNVNLYFNSLFIVVN